MRLFIIAIIGLFAMNTNAQTTIPSLARIGGKGIFVFCGEKIPAAKSGITGYKIERKGASDADYKPVAELPATSSVSQFRERFKESEKLVPYKVVVNEFNTDSIWTVGTNSGTIRTLGLVGGSLPVLHGFNMVWLDAQAQPGNTYQYRITALGTNEQFLTGNITYTREVPIAPINMRSSDFRQDGVHMQWFATGKNKPLQLELYRSDNKQAFHVVTPQILLLPKTDTFFYTIIDSTVIPSQIYDYYIKPYDALGNTSGSTDTIRTSSSAYVRMSLPENIYTSSDTASRGIRISWTTHNAAMLKKLTLYRSTNSLKDYKVVATIPATDSVYVDESVEPAKSYFYYFEAVLKMEQAPKRTAGFAGRYESAVQPVIADMVSAEAKTEGIMISWRYVQEQAQGFYVYRMSREGMMQQVSPLILRGDTQTMFSYTDNSTTLAGDQFYDYTVQAISTSNIGGAFSDTVQARPMRAIAATNTASGIEVKREGAAALITWDDLKETDPNTAGYIVMRMGDEGKTDSFNCGRNILLDTTVKPGKTYTYSVTAMTVFGKRSEATEAYPFSMDAALIAAPSAITATVRKDGVKISWQLPENGAGYSYKVIRYTRGSNESVLGTTGKNIDNYIDKTAKEGELYFYKLRSVATDNTESGDSDEVSIRL